MLKEFKEFAVKGNAIDLAIGVIIGAAFSQVVNSIVGDLVNPILNLFSKRVDFSNLSFAIDGSAVRYGAFLNSLINFLIVSFIVFLLVKQINRFRKQPESNTKECPFCKSTINLKAMRCPECTSKLEVRS